jgi:nucleoside-diphosphate-sugar epimerase
MKVLVTGAAGFVGRHLCARLRDGGATVHEAVRRVDGAARSGVIAVGDIGPGTEWGPALEGVDAVVHLAARVHLMSDAAADPLAEYRRVNVEGTLRLARQAAAAGVRRLVFASSVKVNGEGTPPGTAFREADPPAPADPYGVSKHEAEQGLAATAGIETAVVRPPLVYGPGVGANFLRLMRAVHRGVPLPLGAVDNRRSLVYVENLADVLALCASHPAAAGGTFLASDGPPLSTPALVRALGRALGRRPRLVPVPPALLRGAASLVGRGPAVERLCGSLVVDDSRVRAALGWRPPFGAEAGLARTARAYLETAA